MVVAVDLANSSAKRSFALSLEMVTGRATHHIIGGAQGIPERFYTELRVQQGIRDSAPIVSGNLLIGEHRYHLLGVDPFAEQQFRSSAINLWQQQGRELFTAPNRIALSALSARELGVQPGDWLDAVYRTTHHRLQVAYLLDDDHPLAARGLLFTDIAVAQELLERIGRLDRIDLIIDSPAGLQRIQSLLPPGLQLIESDTRNQALIRMTDAFHTNLSAMSLLALLVGGFLIYNSLTFMVLQRRGTLGTLRALGSTPRQLFVIILAETTGLALLGVAAGLLLGIVWGQGLVHLVTRSINDLYYSLEVSRFMLDPLSLLKGLLLGLATSLLAALLPAWEAARVEPVNLQQRSGLHIRLRRHLLPLTLSGLLLVGLGLVLAYYPASNLRLGFLALALTVLGFSLTVPYAVNLLAKGLGRLSSGRLVYRLAVRGISAGLSRTGLAIAALTIAVATTIGVGIMIESFRGTLIDWLDQSLNSDIYITMPGSGSDPGAAGLPPALLEAVQKQPGVASIWHNRMTRVETRWGPMRLMAISDNQANHRGFNLKQGDPDTVREAFFAGRGVLISEPLSFHHNLHPGDRLTLTSTRGEESFPILGVFYDYTSSHGLILMSRELYRNHWQDDAVSALGVYLLPDADRARVLEQLRHLSAGAGLAPESAGDSSSIRITPNADLKNRSIAIFDRTFTITQVLRLLSILVAFVGILSALMALQLERSAEFALLRASGATPREVKGLIFTQTGLMGLFAGLLAIPLGYLMSQLLIEVINLRSFGWSMMHYVPWRVLFEGILLACAAALLAGLYPAKHAARMHIAHALREE